MTYGRAITTTVRALWVSANSNQLKSGIYEQLTRRQRLRKPRPDVALQPQSAATGHASLSTRRSFLGNQTAARSLHLISDLTFHICGPWATAEGFANAVVVAFSFPRLLSARADESLRTIGDLLSEHLRRLRNSQSQPGLFVIVDCQSGGR
jgi:hypothetical protein